MPEEIKDPGEIKDPEEIKDPNTIEQVKVIRSYESENNTLKIIDTPEEVIPKVQSYNISEIQRQIDRINRAIQEWEDKKAPLQSIIDKYEELNPVVIDNPSVPGGEEEIPIRQ